MDLTFASVQLNAWQDRGGPPSALSTIDLTFGRLEDGTPEGKVVTEAVTCVPGHARGYRIVMRVLASSTQHLKRAHIGAINAQ